MSYQLTAWAVRQKTGSSTRKAVLMALANAASHHSGTCEPHIDVVADETELNERTVRRALDDLVEAGLILREMQHKANGHRAGYIYTFPRLLDTPPGSGEGLPDPLSAELPGTESGQELELELQEEQDQVDPSTESPVDVAVMAVTGAWLAHAPPLIQHRPMSLQTRTLRALICRKLTIYEPEAICDAIANYATVLGGDEWMWTHSWTITDFLNRGLDRFVPEARPLENFRVRREKFGRRDVSARELNDLADRLQSEQRREIESGSG